MRQAVANYQKNQVAGMNQKDLIVMLYTGAIKFLDQAREELDNNKTDAFADRVERVHRIVYHLYTTLDFDSGGEIAEKLGSLYSFLISQLYVLNSTRNESIITDVKDILINLKEGWQNLGTGTPEATDVDHEQRPQVNLDKPVSMQV